MHKDIYPTLWSNIENFTVLKILYVLPDYSSPLLYPLIFLLFENFNLSGILSYCFLCGQSLLPNLKLGCYGQQIPGLLLAHTHSARVMVCTSQHPDFHNGCWTQSLTLAQHLLLLSHFPSPLSLSQRPTIHTSLVFNYMTLFILVTFLKAVCPNSIMS